MLSEDLSFVLSSEPGLCVKTSNMIFPDEIWWSNERKEKRKLNKWKMKCLYSWLPLLPISLLSNFPTVWKYWMFDCCRTCYALQQQSVPCKQNSIRDWWQMLTFLLRTFLHSSSFRNFEAYWAYYPFTLFFLYLSQSKSKSESKVQFKSQSPKSKVQVKSPSLKSKV